LCLHEKQRSGSYFQGGKEEEIKHSFTPDLAAAVGSVLQDGCWDMGVICLNLISESTACSGANLLSRGEKTIMIKE